MKFLYKSPWRYVKIKTKKHKGCYCLCYADYYHSRYSIEVHCSLIKQTSKLTQLSNKRT